MYRICLVLVLLPQFVSVAAEREDSADRSNADWREFVIPNAQRAFDFKITAQGSVPEHLFILRNPLQETIHIGGVISSCDCVTVHFDTAKTRLATYEEIAIAARFRADRFTGQRNATITVVIDSPIRTEIQLHVRGEIRTDLRIVPDTVDFKNVGLEQGASQTLTVTYTGNNAQWRLVDALSENEFIQAEISGDSAQSRVGMRVFHVNVSIAPSAPNGSINTHLVLISNDASHRREIPIPIRATVGTVLRVSPSALSLGILQPGEPSLVRAAVLSGTQPFRITKIESDNPAIEISVNTPNARNPPNVRNPVGETSREASRIYTLLVSYRNPLEGDGVPVQGVMRAAIQVSTDIPNIKAKFYATATVREE